MKPRVYVSKRSNGDDYPRCLSADQGHQSDRLSGVSPASVLLLSLRALIRMDLPNYYTCTPDTLSCVSDYLNRKEINNRDA
jgi:hypothetical protein